VLGLDHSCEVSPEQASLKRKPICERDARNSIMYPLPIEPEREAVLEPGRGERTALCALYARGAEKAASR
jgi:hypothetical protein